MNHVVLSRVCVYRCVPYSQPRLLCILIAPSQSCVRLVPVVSKVLPTRPTGVPPKAAVVPRTVPRVQQETNGSGAAASHQIEELTTQVLDMKLNVEGLEKERDFYFSKLRDIEIMCQEVDGSDTQPLVQKILDVLYQTEVGGCLFVVCARFVLQNSYVVYSYLFYTSFN